MSLKRNAILKSGTSAVVSGAMKALNQFDSVQYDFEFDPNAGSDDFRRIQSLKIWLIDGIKGSLYAVPTDDTAVFNGTELIPGSWGAAVNGFYEVSNAAGEARVFLSSTTGTYHIVIPPLSVLAADYLQRQGTKPLVLHIENKTQDNTQGTFQIPLTLHNIGRTGYSGAL